MPNLKRSLFAALIASVSAVALPAFAQTAAPTTAPSAAPSAEAPATQPLVLLNPVSDDAKVLLDKLSAAIDASKGFSAAGTFTADVDIAGQKENTSKAFSSSFATPFLFKHEVKDEFYLGSTGEKVYAYKPDEKQYLLTDAPKARAAAKDMPALLPQVLRTQNPLLLLALTQDSSAELVRGASKVTRVTDTKIAEAAFPTISIESQEGPTVAIAFDATTSLIRRVTIDFSKVFIARQAPDVKKALLITDYATVSTDAPANASFAWAPPEGAKDIAKAEAANANADPAGEAAQLVNKPAPDFTLKDESGKDVKLSDLKGSVVVVDFWATWCGPCREGLPHLDKLYADRKAKGLKVYAINLKETADQVAKFKQTTGLKLPVLFDTEGATATAYRAAGIPQTVVIGKDGVIRKIVVGFNPDEADKLNTEVDAALADTTTPAPAPFPAK